MVSSGEQVKWISQEETSFISALVSVTSVILNVLKPFRHSVSTEGMTGLMATIVVGNRKGFGRDPYEPHNILLTSIGAALLWVGWTGFSAGASLTGVVAYLASF